MLRTTSWDPARHRELRAHPQSGDQHFATVLFMVPWVEFAGFD